MSILSILDLIPVTTAFDPRQYALDVLKIIRREDETAQLAVVGRWIPEWVQPDDGSAEYEGYELGHYEEVWCVESRLGPARNFRGVEVILVAY